MPTVAAYLEKWLKQTTSQGLNNPLVKMPIKRFRSLDPAEFGLIEDGHNLVLGTLADPIARNLHKNYQERIRDRGEHCGFVSFGSVEITIAGVVGERARTRLFPVCLKRASLQANRERVFAVVDPLEHWRFNPLLAAQLKELAVDPPPAPITPADATAWVKAQLGNRATAVTDKSYVGLFSSQQMVFQDRLRTQRVRVALSKNPVLRAKLEGRLVQKLDKLQITDDGLEELGLVLPCDDSQLRVVQLSGMGHCLQVEGPPGTGKSQTIANVISNALFQGRNVLLVCDKRAAITQVEERLVGVGLGPALLNLHDEDLNKKEFLAQATQTMNYARTTPGDPVHQLNELQELRTTLNERVRFSREITHPSIKVTRREALAGLIRLKKELRDVPDVEIANWKTIPGDRLQRVLASLEQWPKLEKVLADKTSIWNSVVVESFEDNPNAVNELIRTIQTIRLTIKGLDDVRELASSVGIELPLHSDRDVDSMLALVTTVLDRPANHDRLIGNQSLRISELEQLQSKWNRRDQILAARHPVELSERFSEPEVRALQLGAEGAARTLLAKERARTWNDLLRRHSHYKARHAEFLENQTKYRRLCDKHGLVYSRNLSVRRGQLHSLLGLGSAGASIPPEWWSPDSAPTESIATWKAHMQACAAHSKAAPFPIDFMALESLSRTHWQHLEAKAEHGFNLVSYCVHFVDDRKCKYALRQIFPKVPTKGFKMWEELTLQALTALRLTKAIRSAAETHDLLKRLSSTYLALPQEAKPELSDFLNRPDLAHLEDSAAKVVQMRQRDDLFDVRAAHWQTFWWSQNARNIEEVRNVLDDLESLTFPEHQTSGDIEEAQLFYEDAHQTIRRFVEPFEAIGGNLDNSVLESFAAQREFADVQRTLHSLPSYLELLDGDPTNPDWESLKTLIAWRDLFERLRGRQLLDIRSERWRQLKKLLDDHKLALANGYKHLKALFRPISDDVHSYSNPLERLASIEAGLENHALWLEKARWKTKINTYPEIKELWRQLVADSVPVDQAQRLFCFNLLRRCKPIPTPIGPEFQQILTAFQAQDENLATWVIEELKVRLTKTMEAAADFHRQSAGELRRLAQLQRINGSIRTLVNTHAGYLRAAKPCWLMSPTSVANLLDTTILGEEGTPPFDLVIFDEASQIKMLDGLLCVAFGRQVIIVGDKHQLPPTDFFNSLANNNEDQEELGTSESLLEEFSGVFEEGTSQVMLMSHYRSETPDLIQFSNKWFYGEKLEIYPPARVAGLGRRLHYVPDAVYSENGDRSNPREAEEVVGLIKRHVKDHKDKSLGVVTMNLPQLELIEELLLKAKAEVREFCQDEAKFFLRNLETVQGDEMDRIIVSLTYGKKGPAEPFNASVLGPLIKSGGERRLNVAITRSRSGLMVVSSLTANDLESSNAQSRGFECLKAFLNELENGDKVSFGLGTEPFKPKADGVSNLVFCESPFEEEVVEFLENEGYNVACQYGAGKFRLDIVIKHEGKNVIAVECDGAAYHSSLVARTRDRARQKVLERLGWRIHRVWSTNWWHSQQEEQKSLLTAIKNAWPTH